MKRYFPKFAGLVLLSLLVRTSGFAQDDSLRDDGARDDNAYQKQRRLDEIVIRHRGDKDVKVTIEMKNGEVFVNGKPLSEYDDSSLSIRKLRANRFGTNVFSYNSPTIVPDMPGTVRGFPKDFDGAGWRFSGNDVVRSNRAMLGVSTKNDDDVKGAKVLEVTKGSIAEKIGLRPGDVITKVDGEEIDNSGSLSERIGDHQPGDKVTITYTRDGKEQKVTAVLGKMKTIAPESLDTYRLEMPDMPDLKAPPAGNWPKEFHMYFDNPPKFGIRAQDAEDGKGVKVLEVDDASTAAKAGIKEGDVITRFDGKEVNSVAELSEAAHEAKDKINVKLSIVRDGKSQELEVKVPRRLHTADL